HPHHLATLKTHLLLGSRLRRHPTTSPVISHQQPIMLPHMLRIPNQILQQLVYPRIALLLCLCRPSFDRFFQKGHSSRLRLVVSHRRIIPAVSNGRFRHVIQHVVVRPCHVQNHFLESASSRRKLIVVFILWPILRHRYQAVAHVIPVREDGSRSRRRS